MGRGLGGRADADLDSSRLRVIPVVSRLVRTKTLKGREGDNPVGRPSDEEGALGGNPL